MTNQCQICGSKDIDSSGIVDSDPISGPVGTLKCNNCGAKNDIDAPEEGWYGSEEACGICGSEDIRKEGYQQEGYHGSLIRCLECDAVNQDGRGWEER